jgi:beta-1,4-mannosyl-glycoprotein beta-1,4-N-acetylglucosaminyltransferase
MNDSNLIRAIHFGLDPTFSQNLQTYKNNHLVRAWFMGEDKYYAGWHCSSCFKPEGIRIKFMSAQNADYPRWGSIPDKMDLNYIKNLIKEGKWFDGSKIPLIDIKSDSFYAPQHILQNANRYKYILFNPYVDNTPG